MTIKKHLVNKYSVALSGILLCLVASSAMALPVYQKMDPLLKTDNVAIHPESRHPRSNARDWCGSRTYASAPAKFEVVYDVPHQERDGLFPNGYQYFVDRTMRSVVAKHCENNPVNVNLYFYRRGEDYYYERMDFQIRDKNGNNDVQRLGLHANPKHPLAKVRKADSELGACSEPPFCELAGGIYLNAIYNNNGSLVRELDQQIMTEVRSNPGSQTMEKFAAILAGGVPDDAKGQDLLGTQKLSMLKPMAVKYMDQYGKLLHHRSNNGSCRKEDAVQISRKSKTKVVHYEDQYGNDQGSVGGIEFGAIYIVNREFAPLCETICGSMGSVGGDLFADGNQSYKAKIVLAGVSEVLAQLDCNSPEVKQFERNLIALTTAYINDDLPAVDKPKAQSATESRNTSTTVATTSGIVNKGRTRGPQNTTVSQRRNEASRSERMVVSNYQQGEQFLANNKTRNGVKVTPTGLQYTVLSQGQGAAPGASSSVTVHYRGTLIDGTEIGNSYATGRTSTLPVNAVMAGWTEGLQLIKPGGKIKLFIPAKLAYADRAVGNIQPGSALIYEIELIKVN